jgi:hypothetical protein
MEQRPTGLPLHWRYCGYKAMVPTGPKIEYGAQSLVGKSL